MSALDWGIVNSLFALDPSRRYHKEAFEAQLPAQTAVPTLQGIAAQVPGPKLFVTHAPGKLIFQQSGTKPTVVNVRLRRTIAISLSGRLVLAGPVRRPR